MAGSTLGPHENESSLRTMRRRRGAGTPTPVSKDGNSSSSSGRLSTRSRAFKPPSTANSLLDDGDVTASVPSASFADAASDGIRSRERRSERAEISKSGNQNGSDSSDREREFGEEDECSHHIASTKKRKRSSLTRKDKGDIISSTSRGRDNETTQSTISDACPDDKKNDNDNVIAEKQKIQAVLRENVRKPLVLLGEKPRGMYECDYCTNDITRTPRIRCADCPDFDLCLECFAGEDHHRMAKYKREEEAQRRKEAAKIAGLEFTENGNKIHHGSKRNTKGSGKVADEELGSYVGETWVPYFRHKPEHRYIVADSTRYVMFPSFRGVTLAGVGVDGRQSSEISVNQRGYAGGGIASKEKKEDTIDTGIDNEKDNKESAHESVKSTHQEQCQLGQEKSSHDASNTDVDTKDAKNAITNIPVDDVVIETNAPKDLQDIQKNLCGEIKHASEGSYDELKVSDATKDETTSTLEERTMSRNPVGKTLDAQTNDRKAGAAILQVPDTNTLGSTLVQETKHPRIYRVTDDIKNSWTAEEDLRLLDGILSCGLGNWTDVAEHVNGILSGEVVGTSGGSAGEGGMNSMKTEKQCMERYLDDFMGRYGCILPPFTLTPKVQGHQTTIVLPQYSLDGESLEADAGLRKRSRRSISSSILGVDDLGLGFKSTTFHVKPTEKLDEYKDLWPYPYIPPIEGVGIGDEVGRDLWYRSEQKYINQIASFGTSDEAENFRKEFIERRTQNLPGYEAKVLPPRLEDVKRLPGAELAGYMPRRGEFDMEWDNDAEKIISEMEFTRDDSEADRQLKLDVLRIFNSKLDEREKRKQFIIDRGLLNYRENQQKLSLMAPDERQLVQRMRIFAQYQTREEHDAFVNKIIEAKRLRKEIHNLQLYRRMGITSLADAEKYEMDKTRRDLHRIAWTKKEEEKRKTTEESERVAKEHAVSSGISPPVYPQELSNQQEAINVQTNQSLLVWKTFKRPNNESESLSEDKPAEFSLKDKPGFELLTKKEVGLCKRLLLLPQIYLDVKRALISESIARGIWDPRDEGPTQKHNKPLFKIDVTQQADIVNFLLESHWIDARPSDS